MTRRCSRRRWWLAVLAVVIVAGCATPPGTAMPSFTLVDQSGAAVRSETLRGQALVVSFVFSTCVEACPLITAQLARVQARAHAEHLDGRVRFVSITLDPLTDTPDVLRRYAETHGIDLTTWQLLTGPPAEVARVISAFGFATVAGERTAARDRVVHSSLVVLIDREGRVADRHTDLELDPERLLARLRKLLG